MSNTIFYPPPQPMTGGSQPLDHDRKRAATEFAGGDEPPKRHPMRSAAMLAVVMLSWWTPQTFALETIEPLVWVERVDQPPARNALAELFHKIRAQWDPEQSTQPQRVFYPSGVVPVGGNDPPFGLPQKWLNHVISTWMPLDPQPWSGYKLNPAFEEVTVNEPPYSHPLRVSTPQLWTLIRQWQPPDPQPQRSGPLPVAVTSIVGDSPPIGKKPPIYFVEPNWPAQSGAKIAPLIPAVVPEQVPFRNTQLGRILASWQGETFALEVIETLVWVEQIDNPPIGKKPLIPWFDHTWDAQRSTQVAPLIPVSAPVNDPPFGYKPFRGDTTPESWPTQETHKLVQARTGDDPPFGYRPFRGDTTPEFWSAQDTHKTPLAPINNPPFGYKPFRGDFTPESWPAQSAGKLVQPSLGDQPPGFKPFQGHQTEITWSAQDTRKYPQVSAAVNDPPFGYRPFRGDFTPDSWPAQSADKLVQATTGDNPPFGYRPFQGHQAELTWNAQDTRKYPQSPAVVITAPPFGYRPFLGDLTPPTWLAQDTRKLIQPSTGDNPPFGYKLFQGYLQEEWRLPPINAKLPQGTPAQVDNPPLSKQLPAAILEHWQPSTFTLDVIEGRVVQSPTDNPPFGIPKPTDKIIQKAWEPIPPLPERNRKLNQGTPPQVDQPPLRVPSWPAPIVASWETIPYVVDLWVLALERADNPPLNHSTIINRVINESWQPIPFPLIKSSKLVQGTPAQVNDPPFGYRPFFGDFTPLAWGAQDARKLVQGSTGDAPPFGYKPFRGDTTPESWSTQDRRKSPVGPINDPPFGYRPFRGDFIPQSWSSQDTRKTPLESIDNPPLGYRPFQGHASQIDWSAQSRLLLPQGTPPVVNDPPFHGPLPQLYLIVSTWEPPFRMPQRLTQYTEEGPPPPFGQEYRKLITLREDRIDVIKG